MNYFAHAVAFLDQPYLAITTGIPDMLMVVDRQVRVRSRHVADFLDDPDEIQASVARGVSQHLHDDKQFHATQAFTELSATLSLTTRDALGDESTMRPRFLGHLLVEVLLDATLIAERPEDLDVYYGLFDRIDPDAIQQSLNRMTPRPSRYLGDMIRAVHHERFLWDYLEDHRLMVRLNQVLRRVKLAPLPPDFISFLADARSRVAARRNELLEGIPAGLARAKQIAYRPAVERRSEVA